MPAPVEGQKVVQVHLEKADWKRLAWLAIERETSIQALVKGFVLDALRREKGDDR
jgi:hypothetical protein